MILQRRGGIGDAASTGAVAAVIPDCSGFAAYFNPLCWGCIGQSEACWAGNASTVPTSSIALPPAPVATTPVGYNPQTGTITDTGASIGQVAVSPTADLMSQLQAAIAGANIPGLSNIDWSTWLPILVVGGVAFLVLGQAFGGKRGRR